MSLEGPNDRKVAQSAHSAGQIDRPLPLLSSRPTGPNTPQMKHLPPDQPARPTDWTQNRAARAGTSPRKLSSDACWPAQSSQTWSRRGKRPFQVGHR